MIMYQLKAFQKLSGSNNTFFFVLIQTLPILDVLFDLSDGKVIFNMRLLLLSYIFMLCIHTIHAIAYFKANNNVLFALE